MGRTTKQLSGGGKDKFLRALAHAVPEMPAAAADRIGDMFAEQITEVRVRREAWEALSKGDRGGGSHAVADVEPTAVSAFDPFAFSAVAVLMKQGRAGLAQRLGPIASAAHLRQLAEAQHLAIDATIADPAALCEAIVAAAERRLAERRAAGS